MIEQERASHVVIGPDDPRAGREEWNHLCAHVGVGPAPDLDGCEVVVVAPTSDEATEAGVAAWGAALRHAAEKSARVCVCVPVWDSTHTPSRDELASRAATNLLIEQVLGLRVTDATTFEVMVASRTTPYVVWIPPQFDLPGTNPFRGNSGPLLRVDRDASQGHGAATVELCRNAFATREERLHTPRWRHKLGLVELHGCSALRNITLTLDMSFSDFDATPGEVASLAPIEIARVVDALDVKPTRTMHSLTPSDEAKGRALAALQRNPHISVKDLATVAGVSRATMYRGAWRGLLDIRKNLQEVTRNPLQFGFKDGSTGNLEVTDDVRARRASRRARPRRSD